MVGIKGRGNETKIALCLKEHTDLYRYSFPRKLDERLSSKSLSFLILSATSSHFYTATIRHRHYNNSIVYYCIHNIIHSWLSLRVSVFFVILSFSIILILMDIQYNILLIYFYRLSFLLGSYLAGTCIMVSESIILVSMVNWKIYNIIIFCRRSSRVVNRQ